MYVARGHYVQTMASDVYRAERLTCIAAEMPRSSVSGNGHLGVSTQRTSELRRNSAQKGPLDSDKGS